MAKDSSRSLSELIHLFHQTAQLLEITGANRFRINAYDRAVRALENNVASLDSLADMKLTSIDGIGKGMADRISEYLDQGSISEHQDLLDQIPTGLLELLDLQGLGPKGVAKLWQEAGVESKADLKAKAQSGELEQLKGFGKKKVQGLLEALEFASKANQRTRIGKAMPVAHYILGAMRQIPGVLRCEYAGSLRRGRETVGDLDILVSCENDPEIRKNVAEGFCTLDLVDKVQAQGETKSSIRTIPEAGQIQVDLRIVEASAFGAAWLYFTGSKQHNVRLRERAIQQQTTLNEYGLYPQDDTGHQNPIASATEEDVYKALGLAWIPPELREDMGEIAKAEQDELPNLIKRSDIKAELHTHTTASDGRWTIRELAAAAADQGFETLAITDHSKGQAQARGLDEKRLEQHIQDIHEVAQEMKNTITVLAGSEVDILTDGQLDYPNSLLAELDFVVASPHAPVKQTPEKATTRLLKAIENPYVSIIGHPTARIINRREGLTPDIEKILDAAAERGIALEINANHYRLDLRDRHARMAIERGIKLAINTDAHGPADLDQLIYGILTARRAGAQAKDVVNCLGRDDLQKWIASTRP